MKPKTPKVLTRLLGTALLVVWGTVGYQIYTAGFAADEDQPGSVIPSLSTRSAQYIYKADVRDPFETIVAARAKPKPPKVVIPWTPPLVKVTGILSGNGGMTAILEGASGDISFLGEGDTTCGVTILKIRSGLVVYSYHNQKKEWTIDGRQ